MNRKREPRPAAGASDAHESDLAGGRTAVLSPPKTEPGNLTTLRVALHAGTATSAWRAARQLIPVAAAIAIWALSFSMIDPRRMTDLGLVSVLPVSVYVAVGILTVSFVFALRRRETHWVVPAAHVVALIVIVHGTPVIAYDTLRYSWAWKHLGIVDYIQRHGSIDPGIGSDLQAYHDWPGFFALSALVTKTAGLGTINLASWGPVFFNLIFGAALLLVFRSLTTDMRHVWYAVWLFFALNWVGQDYFSPQAMDYFLYLVIVGACLRWFRPFISPLAVSRLATRLRIAPAGGSAEYDSAGEKKTFLAGSRVAAAYRNLVTRGAGDLQAIDPVLRRQRPVVLLIVVALCATTVVTHQLTPFMLLLGLVALVAFQVCTLRTLPVLVAVFMGAWFAYIAIEFLQWNLNWIVASIGKTNVGSSSTKVLGHAAPEQVFIFHATRALTVVAFLLADVGLARRVRNGFVDLPVVLLAATPLLMVWGNAYGGEILLRVYLFALPFLAFLAAAIVYPSLSAGRSRGAALLAVVLSAFLLAGFYVIYYGKDRAAYFTKDEVAAAKYLYGNAPPGSLLVAGSQNYPWAFRNYEQYRYASLAQESDAVRQGLLVHPTGTIQRLVAARKASRAYLIITRSQKAEAEMTGELPAGSLDRVEQAAEHTPGFRIVYRGRDAEVFALNGKAGPQ
jgi:hypothetical protein